MGIAASARAVSKHYGEVVALDGVDLDVHEGAVHGLVGPNGAGKTTLLGLLLGLSVPDAGTLHVLGRPLDHVLGVPDGVAGFVDGPGLYPTLTARANLVELVRLRGTGATADDVDAALAEVGLTDVAGDRVRGFSLGMRQRLGLAAAVLARPRLLVLDEPANGLDPAGSRQVHGVLARLAAAGTAVVLSSHRMDDLAALCTDVTVLRTARVVFSGALDELVTLHARSVPHRVVTPDPALAAHVAAGVPGLVVRTTAAPAPAHTSDRPVVVEGPVEAVDALVARLVQAGLPVRELAPVVAPLEAAFLALTDDPSAPPPGVAAARPAAPIGAAR